MWKRGCYAWTRRAGLLLKTHGRLASLVSVNESAAVRAAQAAVGPFCPILSHIVIRILLSLEDGRRVMQVGKEVGRRKQHPVRRDLEECSEKAWLTQNQ